MKRDKRNQAVGRRTTGNNGWLLSRLFFMGIASVLMLVRQEPSGYFTCPFG
ncbi:hypothetical protein [Pontibacter qinzhouensis]|uniref:hypothetical protein n=1 Tax=Pontibacter qinzhouensis TaxID=2603253 RepID=UPI00164F2E1E|nr:hypothetical protein [Pontibacter qinzhouensis]